MATYEVSNDIFPNTTVVYIRCKFKGQDGWFNGSGTIVGNNDILTASHVVYDERYGGWATETKIYASRNAYLSDANSYYTYKWSSGYNWDENGDGRLTQGDNKSNSLYEIENDIALLSLTTDIGSIYGSMGLKFDFNSGSASKLGYPGKYNYNLYYDEGTIYKDSIDNFFWYYKDDIEVNGGDSGGPIYVNSGGSAGYQVVGVHSSSGETTASACALNAHSSWLLEEIESNNYLYDMSFATLTSANSVDEGSNISFTFKTHKSEESEQYTYKLSGVSSSDFSSNALSGTTTIDENGEATFTIGISADQKTEGTENFTVSIGEKTKSISINDTSTDEIKPLITGPSGNAGSETSKKTINENTTTVHTFTANETVTWLLNGGNDPTFFSINSTTGQLTFNNAPDYENKLDSNANGIYSIYIKATDSSGNLSNQWVEITIADVNEAPTNIELISTSFNENIAASTIVSAIASTDADTSDTHTYSLVTGTGDTDNNSFTIDRSSLKIKTSPDYETKSSYSIRLQTTDNDGETYAKAFTLSVKDLNEAPTSWNFSSYYFDENIAADSTVAIISAVDEDQSDGHTYSLIDGYSVSSGNSSFYIDGNQLKIKTSPDYEAQSTYTVVIRVTDAEGLTSPDLYNTLRVNDLEEFTATISGTSTSDSLQSTTSDDSIDGADGTDTVSFTGSFSNYSFTRGSDTLQIADQRTTGTTDGTDTLKNIEYIQFSDQTVEESKVDIVKTYSGEFSDYKFYNKGNGKYEIKTDSGYDDITGYPLLTFTGEATTSSFRDVSAIADIKGTFDQVTGLNTDDAKMFRLYNAAFKRLPDADGLKYWISQYTSGTNDDRIIASSFLVSAEFKQRYGEDVTNAKYVETLYTNMLGRDYDQEGYNYWLGNLNNGTETRYELLLGFAESAESKTLFTAITGFN